MSTIKHSIRYASLLLFIGAIATTVTALLLLYAAPIEKFIQAKETAMPLSLEETSKAVYLQESVVIPFVRKPDTVNIEDYLLWSRQAEEQQWDVEAFHEWKNELVPLFKSDKNLMK